MAAPASLRSVYINIPTAARSWHNCQAGDESDFGEANNLFLILPLTEIISTSCLGCQRAKTISEEL